MTSRVLTRVLEVAVILTAVVVPYVAAKEGVFAWRHERTVAFLGCVPAYVLATVYIAKSFRLRRILWVRLIAVTIACGIGWRMNYLINSAPKMSDISRVRKLAADPKSAETQEEIDDREADAGIWKWGDTKYIHIASSRMDQVGEKRVSFVEGRLTDAGILYSTNGSLGVQGISVPLVDKERALKALSGYLDESGSILPLK